MFVAGVLDGEIGESVEFDGKGDFGVVGVDKAEFVELSIDEAADFMGS